MVAMKNSLEKEVSSTKNEAEESKNVEILRSLLMNTINVIVNIDYII